MIGKDLVRLENGRAIPRRNYELAAAVDGAASCALDEKKADLVEAAQFIRELHAGSMSAAASEPKSDFAIVELFGHKILAGKISSDERYGEPMVRIDVPAIADQPAFTRLYGTKAIYGITYVSEDVARAAAATYREKPLSVYVPSLVTHEEHERAIAELQDQLDGARKQLMAPADDPDRIDDEPDDEDLDGPELHPDNQAGIDAP